MRLKIGACFFLTILSFAFAITGCTFDTAYHPKAGDILFQDLASPQSQAVKLATGSKYTHCGIVFEENGKFVVSEAVGPVRTVPLSDWTARGVNEHFMAYRLDTLYGYLTPRALEQMKAVADSHLGKDYDIVFNWSDEKLYCSELVWKVFYEGFGLKLSELHQLGSYDLSHPAVAAKLWERYGDSIPLEEPVVAPSDLINSKMLQKVYSN